MLVVAKAPHIKVEIKGEGTESIIEILRREVPGLLVSDDDEIEPIRGNDWFEKLEADVTPGISLRVYRDNLGLSLKALSEKTGIPVPHLSGMEHDKRPIGKTNAKKLAEALSCSYRRLL